MGVHVIAWGLIIIFHGALPLEFNNDDPTNDTSFKTFQDCNNAVKATTDGHPDLSLDLARCYPILGKPTAVTKKPVTKKKRKFLR